MAVAIEARRCFQRSASCRCQTRCTMPDQPMVTHSAARNWVSVHRWSCSDHNSLSRRRLAVMISGVLLRSNWPGAVGIPSQRWWRGQMTGACPWWTLIGGVLGSRATHSVQ